ncbi:MAG: helix-turn-helix transcriptional regulator [Bacteroidota bacterium]
MGQRKYIGELEEVIMLTIGILEDGAYGLAIKREIDKRLNRKVSMGAMHTGLYRLEKKGYLTSRLGEATSIRGGKPKRYFTVTMHGQQVLKETMDDRKKLWQSIPEGVFQVDIAS